jgi:hypothetical protein
MRSDSALRDICSARAETELRRWKMSPQPEPRTSRRRCNPCQNWHSSLKTNVSMRLSKALDVAGRCCFIGWQRMRPIGV